MGRASSIAAVGVGALAEAVAEPSSLAVAGTGPESVLAFLTGQGQGAGILRIGMQVGFDVRGPFTLELPLEVTPHVPIGWRPQGETSGCEVQTREDTLHFFPTDANAPVTPKSQTVTITERVRTGKPTWSRTERIDTGVHRKPDYAATARDWSCAADHSLSACRTEKAECGDGKCSTDGYAVNAEPGGGGNGCRFSCRGPEGLLPGISSNFCRFDARMECRLRCREKKSRRRTKSRNFFRQRPIGGHPRRARRSHAARGHHGNPQSRIFAAQG